MNFNDDFYFGSRCGLTLRTSNRWEYVINSTVKNYHFTSINEFGDYFLDKKNNLWISGTAIFRLIDPTFPADFLYSISANKRRITEYGELPASRMYSNITQPYGFRNKFGTQYARYFDFTTPLFYDEKSEVLFLNNCILSDNSWLKINGDRIESIAKNEFNFMPFTYFGQYKIERSMYLGIIQDIAVDDDGNVWYATTSGLVKFTKPLRKQTFPNGTKEISENDIQIKVENGKIRLLKPIANVELTVYDTMGRVIGSARGGNLASMPRFSAGVYVIKASSGNHVSVKKVILR